jgi:membrane complex biogenesis BtpA family protein
MKLPRLIGVVHLPPLPGAPHSHGMHPAEALQTAGALAVQEAQALAKAGFDGLILENFGDLPFFSKQVPPETVASMAIIAAAVREVAGVQIGINILRNDSLAALAVAAVTGCDFIRVNVLSGVVATDQGMIEGNAATLIRERERMHSSVAILADVHVKHGVTLSSFDLGHAIEEAYTRSLADGVILTGRTTGRMIELPLLQRAGRFAKNNGIPIYLGSGATTEALPEIQPWVDGVIVGSDLRRKGRAGAPLDPKRSREFATLFNKLKKRKIKS